MPLTSPLPSPLSVARILAARRVTATRFAPSPTGYLHLGHVASAAAVVGIGRAVGARVLLRIEDHDRGRCRAEYEAAIHADLAWLGFEFDDAELSRAHPSPYRQSDAPEIYDAALAQLAEKSLLFGCDCPRSRLAALNPRAATDAVGSGELIYDGFCRSRGLDWRQGGIGVRVKIPSAGVRFEDLWLGSMVQTPSAQCGDVLLRDRHGNNTYQFAVVVDDMRQKIDFVVRGQDLIASTGRQILLGELLGRPTPPLFAHHPLLVDDGGKKLGKRFFSEAVARRRAAGDRPEMLLGIAAFRLGLQDSEAEVSAQELPALCKTAFDL